MTSAGGWAVGELCTCIVERPGSGELLECVKFAVGRFCSIRITAPELKVASEGQQLG